MIFYQFFENFPNSYFAEQLSTDALDDLNIQHGCSYLHAKKDMSSTILALVSIEVGEGGICLANDKLVIALCIVQYGLISSAKS